MKKLPVVSLFVTLIIGLSGCVSHSVTPEAIHYALQEEATLREVSTQCKPLGGEVAQAASEAVDLWWQRNRASLIAADYGFIDGLEQVFSQRQESSAMTAITVTQQIRFEAETTAQKVLSKRNPEKACLKILSEYRDGKYDLAGNRQYQKVYHSLQAKQQTFNGLDQAKAAIANLRKYGRSLNVVERTLVSQGCQEADISLLRNTWPLEIYDAQCNDRSYQLIRCEWGQCRIY